MFTTLQNQYQLHFKTTHFCMLYVLYVLKLWNFRDSKRSIKAQKLIMTIWSVCINAYVSWFLSINVLYTAAASTVIIIKVTELNYESEETFAVQ